MKFTLKSYQGETLETHCNLMTCYFLRSTCLLSLSSGSHKTSAKLRKILIWPKKSDRAPGMGTWEWHKELHEMRVSATLRWFWLYHCYSVFQEVKFFLIKGGKSNNFTSACSTWVILTRTYLSNSGLWSENDKFYLLASFGSKTYHSDYSLALMQSSYKEKLHILNTFSDFQLYYETKELIDVELRKET